GKEKLNREEQPPQAAGEEVQR
ncbi:MAG: hypothetical protein AVDCRST_MAG90-2470, partial [uncultured Microvirga sp.]